MEDACIGPLRVSEKYQIHLRNKNFAFNFGHD